MTGFIVNVFPFRNRVSYKEAFEGLELGEGKPSRPVLRGPGGRKAAWLLGNRFDDPESYYRVLYASSQEVSCFIETLARYRPDLTLLAELEAIEGDNDFFLSARFWRSGVQTGPWAWLPQKANMPTFAAASGSRSCAADSRPNASAWESRTWMPVCCRAACLVASRNWFRELRMSRVSRYSLSVSILPRPRELGALRTFSTS